MKCQFCFFHIGNCEKNTSEFDLGIASVSDEEATPILRPQANQMRLRMMPLSTVEYYIFQREHTHKEHWPCRKKRQKKKQGNNFAQHYYKESIGLYFIVNIHIYHRNNKSLSCGQHKRTRLELLQVTRSTWMRHVSFKPHKRMSWQRKINHLVQ